MHINDWNNGGSFVDMVPSIVEKNHTAGYKDVHPVIETVLLSDVLKAIHLKDNTSKIIMKMDIEGFECRAILGKSIQILYMIYNLTRKKC